MTVAANEQDIEIFLDFPLRTRIITNAMNVCGCTDDSLCKEGKRLWKLTGSKGRKSYSYHRMKALNLLDNLGRATMGMVDIWANNRDSDGNKLKFPS